MRVLKVLIACSAWQQLDSKSSVCSALCHGGTVCPRSSDPFYTVNYYIKWPSLLLGHTVLRWDGGMLRIRAARTPGVN